MDDNTATGMILKLIKTAALDIPSRPTILMSDGSFSLQDRFYSHVHKSEEMMDLDDAYENAWLDAGGPVGSPLPSLLMNRQFMEEKPCGSLDSLDPSFSDGSLASEGYKSPASIGIPIRRNRSLHEALGTSVPLPEDESRSFVYTYRNSTHVRSSSLGDALGPSFMTRKSSYAMDSWMLNPPRHIPSSPTSSKKKPSVCSNCGTTETPSWRRSKDERRQLLCNACGISFFVPSHPPRLTESVSKQENP